MAFGDALRSNDGATVVLAVDTSQTAKLEQAEAQWRESVGQMSREALKLDLAQERLRKSLERYGAESAQAKRATIALKDAEEQAARAANRQERELRDLERAQRGALGLTRSLRHSVLGLAAAYVGVHGLVAGIRSAVEAAREEELVHGQTRVALEALGISYEEHIRRIEQVIRAQSRLGFDDEALLKTFQLFVRSTKDVNAALALNALAIDVARGRYIDLEQAAQIVNKANLGMSGALRRIGLDVERNASRTKLLTVLQRAYGRAAEEAADTGVAASERLAIEWENMKEIVGRGLLPSLTDLSSRLADYLGDAENQRRLQEQVNRAIDVGEDVVRGFVGALRTVRGVLRPLIDALGGAENAAEAFFIAFGVAKIAGILGALARLRSAIKVLGPTATRSAAISVTALNTIGTAATVNAARVGALRTALLMLAGGGVMAGAAVAGIAVVKGLSEADERLGLSRPPQAKQIADIMERQDVDARRRTWKNLTPSMRKAVGDELRSRGRFDILIDVGAADTGIGHIPDEGARHTATAAATRGPSRTPRGGGAGTDRPAPRTIEDILLDQARAAVTPSSADDLRYHREAAAYYQRQIDRLERRKNLTAKQKEELRRLYGQLAAEQSAIEAIIDEGEAKAEAQRKAAEAKREAAREREAQRMARIYEQAARRAEARAELLAKAKTGRHGWNRQGMRAAALAGVRDTVEGLRRSAGAAQGGLTEAQVRSMQFEFLTTLRGTMNQFGGNLFAPGSLQVAGSPNPELFSVVSELREQTALLAGLSSGLRHPGTRYTRSQLAAIFDGPTF